MNVKLYKENFSHHQPIPKVDGFNIFPNYF